MSEQVAAAPAVARDTAVRPARPRARVGRKRLLLGAAVLVLAAGGAAYGHQWWTVGRFFESTDDAYVGGDVTVMAPRVAGLIARVEVTDNQPVHKGDVLVQLDDRDYRAALGRAQAAVAAEQAALANLAATRQLQDSRVAEAQAAVLAADAETQRARDDQARYRSLAATSAASVQSFQKADADFKTASANSVRARAALQATQQQIGVLDTQRGQIQAALDGATAARDLAQINLDDTTLRAPMDGVVGNRSARPGAYAAIGTQLLSLVPAHGLWVDANFKESQLARMKPGMKVDITADVLPGETFHGRVGSLAPATGAQFSVLPAENATGNFTKIVQRVPVRVVLDDGAAELGRLRPGLSVVASVDERVP